MKLKLIVLATLFPIFAHAATLKSLNSERAPFKLPALPYKTSALEPAIDEQTMQLHHGKHHQAYVDNLNAALPESDKKLTLLEILKSTKKFPASVRNNAGGHWNHSFFWTILTPNSNKTKMSKKLQAQIEKDFGSVEKFKEEFETKAKSLFGSGWTWLIVDNSGKLQITTTANQDNPLMDVAEAQGRPILGLDVWEHAYYLKYQNKRGDYIKAFWNIVNWDQVSKYYSEK